MRAISYRALSVCLLLTTLVTGGGCAGLPKAMLAQDGDIVKSPQDTNQYRHLQLDNEMEVILVSGNDPTAAAVLDVRVGSNSNPAGYPGLAHFLEHLLFLGTEKYPDPQAYQQYISTNGGSYNATTSSMYTSYYFSIDSTKLEPALDRLAQFFIAPLFGRQYVARELAIIESEYQRYRNVEGRAVHRVNQESYNKKHPSSRFSIGNKQVLLQHGEEKLYQALLDFFEQEYSANRMKLVVHGQQSLDELEAMVRKYFSPVVNKDKPSVEFSEDLFSKGSLPMLLQIKPKSEIYQLDYLFPIELEDDAYFVKTTEFLTHMLGHEVKGTLLDYLRNKGWAKGLSAGRAAISDQYFISVRITLSPEGRDHVEEIHRALFAYIDLIRNQGLEKWRYDEVKRMAQINFDYREPSRSLHLSQSMARAMHYVPARSIFPYFNLYAGWRKDRAREIMDELTPNNVRVTITAPDVEVDRKAQWFDIDYSISRFEYDNTVQSQARSELLLPKANSFIPDVIAQTKSVRPPYSIDDDKLTVWHIPKQARQKASLNFGLFTARHRQSLKVRMLKKIYLRALHQRLASEVYMASLAGLNFHLYDNLMGITLKVIGYSDKIPLFFDRLITEMGKWQLSESDFNRYRLELLRSVTNQRNSPPSQRVGNRLFAYLISGQSYRENKIALLEGIKYSDWQDFTVSMKSVPKDRLVLGIGEITKDQIQQSVSKIKDIFPGAGSRRNLPDVRILDNRSTHVSEPAMPGQSTDLLELYLQFPGQGYKKQVAALMLANYLHSPFFHELRTERKLGYQAGIFPITILEQPGIGFIVESDTVSATQLSQYFLDFIDRQQGAVERIDSSTFAQLKQGVISNLLRRDKDIASESARLWRELNRGNTRFDTRELLIGAARQFTLEDFHQSFQDYIINNKRRLWALSQVNQTEHSNAIFGDKVY